MAEKRMTVDEFLVWSEGREGRFELHEGVVVSMSPERARHSVMKGEAYSALRDAIRRAGVPCRAYVDGPTVRVNEGSAFIPEVVVFCPPLAPDQIQSASPLIVVEVLSPSSSSFDHGPKLEGYFGLPSLAHYLILDPDRRVVVHHARGRADVIETRILHSGPLRLDPPGIGVEISDLLGEP